MSPTENFASTLLTRLRAEFETKPFVPPRLLAHADLQTIGAFFWPGRFRARDLTGDEESIFDIDPQTQLLGRCRWHARRRDCPTLVMWHGMEGSSSSAYMLSTAAKAFGAGFNVVRMNVRTCGGTDQLEPTLYHAGLSGDARAVIAQLINQHGLRRIVIAGFSLGGNKVLKLAGEYGDSPPQEVIGVTAISPSVDLSASSARLLAGRNWIYHRRFLHYLKRRLEKKQNLFPQLYRVNGLRKIKTIRDFDDKYVAPAFGFAGVDDYYAKASSLPLIKDIHFPTLIIHAQDDPFVPFGPLQDASVTANPNVLLLAPERGGHVAFISAGAQTQVEDRFWAENRLIDFCLAVAR